MRLPAAALFQPSLLLLPGDCLRLRRVPFGLLSLLSLLVGLLLGLLRGSVMGYLLLGLLFGSLMGNLLLGLLFGRLMGNLLLGLLLGRLMGNLWLGLLLGSLMGNLLLGLLLPLRGWPRGLLRFTLLLFRLGLFFAWLLVLCVRRDNSPEKHNQGSGICSSKEMHVSPLH
jgi:hypothetical protein